MLTASIRLLLWLVFHHIESVVPTRKNTYAEKSRDASPSGTLDILSLFLYFFISTFKGGIIKMYDLLKVSLGVSHCKR